MVSPKHYSLKNHFFIIVFPVSLSGSKQVQETKEQAEGVNASLLKALGRLEHLQVKLGQSTSTVAEANSTARGTNEMVTDSEKTSTLKFSDRVVGFYLKLPRLEILGSQVPML